MPKIAPRLPPGWIRARRYHLLAPLIALALVAVYENTELSQLIEYMTVNLRFQARAPFDPPADKRIVLIGIDQQSLDRLGAWPWPRHIEAGFIQTLVAAQVVPHTLSFDLLFTEESNRINVLEAKKDNNDDAVLGNATGLLPVVISGSLSLNKTEDPQEQEKVELRTREELQKKSLTLPLSNIRGDIHKIVGSDVAIFPVQPIREQSLFGFVNAEPSPIDRIRHTIPLIVRVVDRVYPSLALQTLCQFLGVDADKVEVDLPAKTVTLRNSSHKTWSIPINERGEFTINYRQEQNFDGLSFSKLMGALLDHIKNGDPLPAACNIQGKIVFVGQTATALTDLGPTPLQAQSPLVYTHLNVINNVLKNDYLKFVPTFWVIIGWMLVTWPTLLRLKEAPLGEAVLMPILVAVLYTIFAFAIFWVWSLQIELAWPVMSYCAVNFGAIILRWREEQKGREQIKQVFSRMLSPEVMHHLLAHPENIKMGGSERPVTILFSDIRDYTKFSEGLKPSEVVRQLNVYFEPMVDCIKQSRGTFHKYIGDAIMAAWGDIAQASFGPEKDAQNAVTSALMMRRLLRELNEERKQAGLIPLRIGIGLNHGDDVLVGLIGASSRSEFTVMGDAVNTASRLEGLTKEFHTDLAISESVYQLLDGMFLVRRLGLIVLKGKTKPTVVYEVLAEKTKPLESKMSQETVARYEQAFDDFLARRFAEAEQGFRACEEKYPDDYCVQNYLKASREFAIKPPPPEWDGRIVMTTK